MKFSIVFISLSCMLLVFACNKSNVSQCDSEALIQALADMNKVKAENALDLGDTPHSAELMDIAHIEVA